LIYISSELIKPKVLVFIYNKIGASGPTTSMRLLQNSTLKDKYDFTELYINKRLGKIPKIKYVFSLANEIKNNNPDIIHISGLQLQGFYAVLASRIARKKNIVLAVRGSSTEMINFPKISKLFFRYIIEPLTLRLSKQVYTVCNAMKSNKLIINNTKKNFYGTIHNAAPQIDQSILKKKYIRNSLSILDTDIVFIYTGRVTYEKGIHNLLTAFNKLEYEHIKLIVCGDGPDYEYLSKDNDNKNIIFLGYRNDVINILNESDIFVFPTLHENLSNSLLEAASLGKGIIATNIGGNPEVIIDGQNGILVKPNDTDGLLLAMEKYILNPILINIYGSSAKYTVKKNFNQNILIDKIDDIYSTLVLKEKI